MFARTERLLLRPGWPEDADALAAAIAHEAVAHRLGRLPWPYTRNHAVAWLERPRAACEVDLLILAHEGGALQLVGGIGLSHHGDAHRLGYWLTPSAWGRGYATEAGRTMLGIARHALGLRRIVAAHFTGNDASGRVLAKLGFREVGREPRHNRAQGRDLPCVLFERDLIGETILSIAA